MTSVIFSILYALYECTSYILLLSQQVLIRFIKPWFSLQKCRAIQLRWEIMTTNQTFGYTPTPRAHTRSLTYSTHTQICGHTRTHMVYIETLSHPHTCTSVHFIITRSNQTFKNSPSRLYAVGELGFNSRS